ncbi:hypothetical protein P43SY_011493 [Pythium insidiosum]|uniref:Reverse transcriptase Ty1/copia-type domain-containing protein n=1 Tax=Pythium insidiosum TaxID=114742 RepID=A0AAD5LSQ0_PYTIN|nr:hypothetical protein P43SY_011493 [Pythium insidiosum]
MTSTPILTGDSLAAFKIEKLSMTSNFVDWQREIFLVLRTYGLAEIVNGEETIHQHETPHQRNCFRIRQAKALATIVFSMEREEARKFEGLIETGDVVRVWRAIREEYGQRSLVNPVTLLAAVFSRKMHEAESAVSYIRSLERLQQEIRKTHSDLSDEWLTKIMLTNVIDVFPDISRKFTVDNAQGLHTPLLSEAKNMLISRDNIDTASGRRPLNLCGDISVFETIEDTPPHTLFMANGNEEVVKQKGTVVMLLFNEHSKKMEERLLEDVYYTPNASLNIISLDYLQNKGKFQFSFSPDQQSCFATKATIRLRFVKKDGLYRLRATRKDAHHRVNAIDVEDNTTMLHQRFAHASTGTLAKMQASGAAKGLNLNMAKMNDYECLPVRALLQATDLPESLWGEAYLHAVHTVNVTATKALDGRTPHEALYNQVPDVSHLRTWGCLAYATVFDQQRERKQKLQPRVVPALLVGYADESKGYKLLQIPSCKMLTHREGNIRFMERHTLTRTYATRMLTNAFGDAVPPTHRVITCRWVYAAKADADGYVVRFKARLVIHGFRQRMGIDYFDTYAPVVRFDTIRAIFYYALWRKWEILQFDVKTAFLHGELSEQVYMELPPGREGNKQRVCRLLKSLYGLKQAPRVWNLTLHNTLLSLGLRRLDQDHGLYARQVGDAAPDLLLSVYVDDLLIMGIKSSCERLSQQLRTHFELTSLGQVRYLLGIEVSFSPTRDSIFLSQATYIETILKRFNMTSCNGVATPESKHETLSHEKTRHENMPYREIIGAIQYLVSGTRPDLAHATRYLGQFNAHFEWGHYQKAKRVLRYLRHSTDFGLVIKLDKQDTPLLETFTDADFANDATDRKSVSGYVTQLDGNTISYASKKQGVVALSTAEAEYVAMHEGARDIMWLGALLDELGLPFKKPPTLWCDNMSTVHLSTKPSKHSKMKHVDVKYHFTRNLVEKEKLATRHCGTNEMPADTLTKPLDRVKFERFRDMLGVRSKATWSGDTEPSWAVIPQTADSRMDT